MPWIGKLLGLIAAVGGFAAAYGFVGAEAQVLPPAPTLSVTVPTLPTPPPTPTVTAPLPVPPAPPVAVPPPAPPPPPPAAVVSQATSAVTPPRTVATAPPSPTSAATGGVATSGPSPASSPAGGPAAPSGGETTDRRPAARTRQDGLEAKTQRSRNRVSVRLEFTLPEAKRVFLIVRGPAPSCQIVGVIPFRGRKGENAASFGGRVRGRTLEPGVYLLTISPKRRLAPGARTEYARVASPRRTVPLPDGATKPSCTAAQALAGDQAARFLSAEPVTAAPATAPSTPGPAAPLRPPIAPERLEPEENEDDGVLGAIPFPGEIEIDAGGSAGEAVAAIAAVAVGLIFILMLALVARFMRGNWNP